MENTFIINLPQILLIIGILLLVAEIIFFGFATFVLFFVGIAMLIVGAVMTIGLLPTDLMTAIFSVSILALVCAAVLWKFLKKLQSTKWNKKIEVGLVGYEFKLDVDITPNKSVKHFYSGIEWDVISDDKIKKNTPLRVIQVEVGKLTVKPNG
jgi:membrane protein implicated in regulation of membrane protease activity